MPFLNTHATLIPLVLFPKAQRRATARGVPVHPPDATLRVKSTDARPPRVRPRRSDPIRSRCCAAAWSVLGASPPVREAVGSRLPATCPYRAELRQVRIAHVHFSKKSAWPIEHRFAEFMSAHFLPYAKAYTDDGFRRVRATQRRRGTARHRNGLRRQCVRSVTCRMGYRALSHMLKRTSSADAPVAVGSHVTPQRLPAPFRRRPRDGITRRAIARRGVGDTTCARSSCRMHGSVKQEALRLGRRQHRSSSVCNAMRRRCNARARVRSSWTRRASRRRCAGGGTSSTRCLRRR